MMMICCFMSLSTLFKSYRDDGRVITKGSVQWNTLQSRAESHFQLVSNLGPCSPSRKNETNISKCHLLKFLPSMLGVFGQDEKQQKGYLSIIRFVE